MALVALIRGINVGGSRNFRPKKLAEQLGAVNIGAAGTFVFHRKISRAEIARRLPFDADVIICEGRDILRMSARPAEPGAVRFVSFLPRRTRVAAPIQLPEEGEWLVKVDAVDRRFVFGQYRRDMKTIRQLGALDKIFGMRATTRNWNTIEAIARALRASGTPHSPRRL